MSYKISYGPTSKDTGRTVRGRLPMIALMLFLLSVAARSFWPAEMERLAQMLFPWSQESVQEAASVYIEQIKAGQSVGDSITALCKEILNGYDQVQ